MGEKVTIDMYDYNRLKRALEILNNIEIMSTTSDVYSHIQDYIMYIDENNVKEIMEYIYRGKVARIDGGLVDFGVRMESTD